MINSVNEIFYIWLYLTCTELLSIYIYIYTHGINEYYGNDHSSNYKTLKMMHMRLNLVPVTL